MARKKSPLEKLVDSQLFILANKKNSVSIVLVSVVIVALVGLVMGWLTGSVVGDVIHTIQSLGSSLLSFMASTVPTKKALGYVFIGGVGFAAVRISMIYFDDRKNDPVNHEQDKQ